MVPFEGDREERDKIENLLQEEKGASMPSPGRNLEGLRRGKGGGGKITKKKTNWQKRHKMANPSRHSARTNAQAVGGKHHVP